MNYQCFRCKKVLTEEHIILLVDEWEKLLIPVCDFCYIKPTLRGHEMIQGDYPSEGTGAMCIIPSHPTRCFTSISPDFLWWVSQHIQESFEGNGKVVSEDSIPYIRYDSSPPSSFFYGAILLTTTRQIEEVKL